MLYFDSLVHVTTDGRWFHTRHDASAAHLLHSLEEAAPARACLVGICHESMPDEFILHTCEKHPDLLVPVAGVNPTTLTSLRETEKYLSKLSRAGFRGLKLHPRINGFDLNDPEVDWIMDAAAAVKLPMFLCTVMPPMPGASRADSVHMLLSRHPETTCVLLHGGTTDLLAFSDIVRGFPHAVLDLSFTMLRYQYSSLDLDLKYVLATLDRKCCVGSDFPEYLPSMAKRRTLDLMAGMPTEKIENVLWRNLTALFGI